MESIVGTVRDTKQALSQILEIGQAAANRQRERHHNFVVGVSKKAGTDPGLVDRYAPGFYTENFEGGMSPSTPGVVAPTRPDISSNKVIPFGQYNP